MLGRGRQGWSAALALSLAAVSARADDSAAADASRVSALLSAGAAAAKAKRWDACIAAYSEAMALEDKPATAGELGLCEEQAGQFAAAYGHLHRAREGAPAQPTAEPWKRYQAALDRVAERVAILFVTVTPTNARVVLDGRPVGRADGRGIAVEPGKHTLAARLEGYEDAVDTRAVSAGDLPNVHLELVPKPAARVPEAGARASDGPGAQQLRPAQAPVREAPWFQPTPTVPGVLLGLTYASAAILAVSGATAIGFEVHFSSMRNALAKGSAPHGECTSPPDSAECAELIRRFNQRNTTVDLTIGTAIATAALAAATGVAFGLKRSPLRPSVALNASPYGGGIVVVGAW
jgi:hypothetical protein